MTRETALEIAVDATPAEVWEAIAEGEGLSRWYVVEARVVPGVGGEVWVDWGGGQSGTSRITVWEPERRLRVESLPPDGTPANDPPMAEEWVVVSEEGRTKLRLVHSNIPDAPEWDGFYEDTRASWALFLRTLKWYLEHAPGKPRITDVDTRELDGTVSWDAIVARAGTTTEGAAVHTPAGPGQVLLVREPYTLLVAVPSQDATVAFFGNEGTFWFCAVSTYGEDKPATRKTLMDWASEGL